MFDILCRYGHLVILPIRGFGSCHTSDLLRGMYGGSRASQLCEHFLLSMLGFRVQFSSFNMNKRIPAYISLPGVFQPALGKPN
jgi:hypothetical protein